MYANEWYTLGTVFFRVIIELISFWKTIDTVIIIFTLLIVISLTSFLAIIIYYIITVKKIGG